MITRRQRQKFKVSQVLNTHNAIACCGRKVASGFGVPLSDLKIGCSFV